MASANSNQIVKDLVSLQAKGQLTNLNLLGPLIIKMAEEEDTSTDTFTSVTLEDGTVALPSVTFTSDTDSGIYRIGANNIGVGVNGTKVLDVATTGLGVTGIVTVSSTTDSTTKDTGSIITEGGIGVEKAIVTGTGITSGTTVTVGSSLLTDTITEKTSAANVTVSKAVIYKTTASAINSTATATAAQVKTGLITSTSASAVTITLPTGTDLGTALGAARGTMFDLIVDNTAGSNTVTLAVGVNCIASAWNVYQDVGGAPLDVVSGVTGTAVFRFVFSSATACTFCRIS